MRKLFSIPLFFLLMVPATVPISVASETIRTVQLALLDKGMDPGPVDGLMGSKTRQAIRDFQAERNMKPTGRLDSETQRALGIEVPTTVTIPAGTHIQVVLYEPLSTKTNNQGDRFRMSVSRSI